MDQLLYRGRRSWHWWSVRYFADRTDKPSAVNLRRDTRRKYLTLSGLTIGLQRMALRAAGSSGSSSPHPSQPGALGAATEYLYDHAGN
jgi:hypothetical protein